MRATELLGLEVRAGGRTLGRVVDLRLACDDLRVVALIVGATRRERAAVRLGPVAGPWWLRAPLESGRRRALRVPADDVVEWGPGAIRVRQGP